MSFIDKIRGAINPNTEEDDYGKYDDNGYDDGYDSYADDPMQGQQMGQDMYAQPEPVQQPQQRPQPAPQQPAAPQQGGISLSSSALEIKVIRPEKYDSETAQKIADHLLNHRTVLLNLEDTNKESARRLIDFLSGVAYSIDGYIQKVAPSTFAIVPSNVDVSGEPMGSAPKANAPQARQHQNNTDDMF